MTVKQVGGGIVGRYKTRSSEGILDIRQYARVKGGKTCLRYGKVRGGLQRVK